MCQVLVQAGNLVLVLERTTTRLCHVKVDSPWPKCEVEAVFVSVTPRLKAFWILLGFTELQVLLVVVQLCGSVGIVLCVMDL